MPPGALGGVNNREFVEMRQLIRAAIVAVGLAFAGGGAVTAAPLAVDGGLVASRAEAAMPNVEKAYYGYGPRWGYRRHFRPRFFGPRFGYGYRRHGWHHRHWGWRHRHWGHRRHFGPRFYGY